MSALTKALQYWDRGYRIPLHIAASLMAAGYDVAALEARHMNHT